MPRGRPRKDRNAARPPMGVQLRMQIPAGVDVPANKVARWVTDVEGRIEAFLERDWQIVSWPEGADSRNSRAVPGSQVRKKLKAGDEAVLMMLDKDLYDQDQQAKIEETRVAEIDRVRPGGPSPEYVPGGGDNALRDDNPLR